MAMKSMFSGLEHVSLYAQYRPTPPRQLIDKILEYTGVKIKPPFKLAVDVGCGSGQSTEILSEHFEKVIGVDSSQTQIDLAKQNTKSTNVEYNTGYSENLSDFVQDGAAQLITVSQAAHWLNMEVFYKVVNRVLQPGGCLAVYMYNFPVPVDPKTKTKVQPRDDPIMSLYLRDTQGPGKYWNSVRQLVDDEYKDIKLPFTDCKRLRFTRQEQVTVAHLVGYVTSWSGFQALRKDNPDIANAAIANLVIRLLKILNNQENMALSNISLDIEWSHILLLGRK